MDFIVIPSNIELLWLNRYVTIAPTRTWGRHFPEAVAQRCSVKMVLLEISQNSQENTSARVSFLIKLQA